MPYNIIMAPCRVYFAPRFGLVKGWDWQEIGVVNINKLDFMLKNVAPEPSDEGLIKSLDRAWQNYNPSPSAKWRRGK